MRDQVWTTVRALAENESHVVCTPPAPTDPHGHFVPDADTIHHHLLPRVLHLQKMALRQIRDLLKSACAIGWPYLILVQSADSVTAVSMLRELHTTTCLQCLQVDLRDKSVKLSFYPFCAYAGGNDLSYLNHIIIAHYNASYRCRKCLKQAFVSSSALHNHKKVCLGLASKKSARVSEGKPRSSRGDSSHRGSFKATPKKDSKAVAANSQCLSTPSASQQSPRHSRREASHHHKSYKKDSAEKKKGANNVSPVQKRAEHKACKDGGCH